MNSNTVDFVNSADQTFVETVVVETLPVETKKKPVLKAIPKKIMGYLKFAHFVLGANDDTIVSKLFLDKSIEQIIAIVNDVVENGNQDKTINDLRKQLINSAKPKKTRSKKTKNTDDADAIVTDLVTLARTTDTPAVPKKTRAKKSDTESGTETPVVEKKVRAKKTKTPIVAETTAETIAQTNAETTAETIADTIAETIAQTTAETIAETNAETIAETTAETIAEPVKKSITKKVQEKKSKAPVKSSDIVPSCDQEQSVNVDQLAFQTPPKQIKKTSTPNAPKKNID